MRFVYVRHAREQDDQVGLRAVEMLLQMSLKVENLADVAQITPLVVQGGGGEGLQPPGRVIARVLVHGRPHGLELLLGQVLGVAGGQGLVIARHAAASARLLAHDPVGGLGEAARQLLGTGQVPRVGQLARQVDRVARAFGRVSIAAALLYGPLQVEHLGRLRAVRARHFIKRTQK